MLKNLYFKTILDYRFSILGWSLGLILMTALYVSLFPSIMQSGIDLNALLEKMPDALKAMIGNNNYNTPIGYIDTEFFSILGPILFIFFAIGYGSSAIAGEEEKGTLDVLLAYPISRSKVLVQKAGALLTLVATLCLVLYGSLAIGAALQSMKLDLGFLGAAVLSLGLLAFFFGMLSLMIGCVTGNKSLSIGLASAFAAGSYILDTLGKTVKSIEPLRKFNPFFFYHDNNPLANGLDISHVLILLGFSLLFLLVGLYFLQKRDLNI